MVERNLLVEAHERLSRAHSHRIGLTFREVTLIRVGLLQRLSRLKPMMGNPDLAKSYEEIRALLNGKLHHKHWTSPRVVTKKPGKRRPKL